MNIAEKPGAPVPGWLKKMTLAIHEEMDEIRLHDEHNCRKIYTPESPFSSEFQAWYDRIHAYLALIKLLEDSTNRNADNTFRFARRKGIENPKSLSLRDIKQGLQFCRMRQIEARRKAHPLREDHLLDCLRTAIKQNKKKKIAHIKQIINGERSRKDW